MQMLPTTPVQRLNFYRILCGIEIVVYAGDSLTAKRNCSNNELRSSLSYRKIRKVIERLVQH
jgi:hypothetical protein